MRLKTTWHDKSRNYRIGDVGIKTWEDYYDYTRHINNSIQAATMCLVYYEDIVSNLVGNIDRIVHFRRLIKECNMAIIYYNQLLNKARDQAVNLPKYSLEEKIEKQR